MIRIKDSSEPQSVIDIFWNSKDDMSYAIKDRQLFSVQEVYRELTDDILVKHHTITG